MALSKTILRHAIEWLLMPRVTASPFTSADRLYREDRAKSENRRRFERWVGLLVREGKLGEDWREDPEAGMKAKWVDGKAGELLRKKRP